MSDVQLMRELHLAFIALISPLLEPNAMPNLRVGVVGAGFIANSRHLPAYQNNDRVEVIGIHDKNERKAESVSRNHETPAYGSFDELCEAADVVSLCTPPRVHCEQAVAAMETGCHVLTEKPMAMSMDEAMRMIETAEETNRVFSVVHNFIFMKSIRDARERVAAGEIGNVVRTQAFIVKKENQSKEYVQDALERGDVGVQFWDEAPHMMYLTRAFIGEMNLGDAQGTTHNDRPGYRSVRAQFTGEGDALGGISFMWDAPLSEWWFVIFGEDGLIAVDIYRDLLLQFSAEAEHSALRVISLLYSAVGQAALGGITAGLRYLQDRFVEGYEIPDAGFSYQIHCFVDAVIEGEEPPITGAESRAVLGDMYAISEATGISVTPDNS